MNKSTLITFLKGFLIGVAEIIPGISGGTIALIVGVYEKLIYSIANINLVFLHKILSGKFKLAWDSIDGNFLFLLTLGMASALFSLSSLIIYLLTYHPFLLTALFSGLLLGSLIIKPLKPHKIGFRFILGFSCSILPVYFLFTLPQIIFNELSLIYLFFGGFLAVCALILPGVSGSFVLLLLGLYPFILSALNNLDFYVLGIFILGCLTGLFSFVRLVRLVYSLYREILLSFFYGLVLFSIPLIWQRNIMNFNYTFSSKEALEVVSGVILGLIFILVISLRFKRN